MLRDKRGVSACGIISCRIKAVALARAFNSRLWPCSWMPQKSSAEGMSSGVEDEEEFFEASPSPENLGDESLHCLHKSAATEAGREKLYELLQLHATDDAIDVFYDVSEDAGACDMLGSKQANGSLVVVDKPTSQNLDCLNSLSFGRSNVSNGEATAETSVVCSNGNTNRVEIESAYGQSKLLTGEIYDDDCNEIQANSRGSLLPNNPVSDLSDNQLKINCECEKADCECLKHPTKPGFDTTIELSVHGQTLKCRCLPSEIDAFSSSQECGENTSLDQTQRSLRVQDLPKGTNGSIPEDILSSGTEAVNTTGADADEGVLDTLDTDECGVNALGEYIDECDLNALGEEASQDINKVVSIEFSRSSTPSPGSETKSPIASRLQVFEERRPVISRSTSLKTGKTPPGTPGRKKIVRFADVLGLDLEDVHHIMTGDIPVIPSSAYTDLNLKDFDQCSYGPVSNTVEVKSRLAPCWNTFQGVAATVGLHPNFPIPGEQPDFLDRVRTQGVCLESVVVSDMCIQCTCRVMNYGYHKKVVVRYTVDDWLSCSNVYAVYIPRSSRDGMDGFRFSIFLAASNRSVKFAIKYTVNGQECWDNNRSHNYCLSHRGHDSNQPITGSIWTHQFW